MPDEDAGNDEDKEEAIDHTAENARGKRNAAGPPQIFGAFCAGEPSVSALAMRPSAYFTYHVLALIAKMIPIALLAEPNR